ncbi:MAG: aminotransferase class I/II-fold pyridoxal phosphate-dependent enzyme [Tissierellia bacterium]|nr:aminotransferase class I/II-fold pyridoxal phosphate-dependent enzyme [Tissierellia bacterium]
MKEFEKFHSRKDESASKWLLMEQKAKFPIEDVVPMSVADMDFEPAKEIKEGLKEYVDATILGYTRPSDSYFLAVSNYYKKRFNLDVNKDEIIPIMGVVSGLFTAVRTVAKPGEGVIVFPPVYPNFYHAINMTGRKEIRCPLIYEDKEYYIDFELFEELAKEENNKALILCSPHNPSGRIWTDQDLLRVLEICHKYDLYLISDEIHADLVLYDNEIKTILNLAKDQEKIIVFSSASKSYNIAGLQTANTLIKNKNLRKAFGQELEKMGFHWPNMMGLKATELAYNHGKYWLDEALKVIEGNFKISKDFFESYQGLFDFYDSQSTYLAWVGFEKLAKKYRLSAEEFYQFLDDSLFFVNPGNFFGKESEYFIRINLALPRHKYEENIARLREKLKERFDI